METLPLEPPPPLAPPLPAPAPRLRRHLVLLAATFVTLTATGAWCWTDSGLTEWSWGAALSPRVLVHGIPYALLVILILGAHEMGHYMACQYYGVQATLPFFLPGIPFIGTFGAVIRIRSQIPTRRALFDIAAAGPIAGFALALPVLAAGIALAHPAPVSPEPHGTFIGVPLVSWLLDRAMHGNVEVQVGSIYVAAWVGMLVTSLNLLPVGQLDGGHALFAISPALHRIVSWVTIATFAALVAEQALVAHTVSGYVLWLVILLLLRDRHPRLVDEVAPLGRRRVAIAIGLALMLLLTFMPVPLQVL